MNWTRLRATVFLLPIVVMFLPALGSTSQTSTATKSADEYATAIDSELAKGNVLEADAVLKRLLLEYRQDPRLLGYQEKLCEGYKGQLRDEFKRLPGGMDCKHGASIVFVRGLVQFQKGEYAAAQRYFQRAAMSNPSVDDAFYYNAACDEHLGNLKEAISAYEVFVANLPGHPLAASARQRLSALKPQTSK